MSEFDDAIRADLVAEVERLRALVDKQLIPAQREVERLRAATVKCPYCKCEFGPISAALAKEEA